MLTGFFYKNTQCNRFKPKCNGFKKAEAVAKKAETVSASLTVQKVTIL